MHGCTKAHMYSCLLARMHAYKHAHTHNQPNRSTHAHKPKRSAASAFAWTRSLKWHKGLRRRRCSAAQLVKAGQIGDTIAPPTAVAVGVPTIQAVAKMHLSAKQECTYTNMYVYIYMHSCVHLYISSVYTYIHAYRTPYLHTYVLTYIHLYICTDIHTQHKCMYAHGGPPARPSERGAPSQTEPTRTSKL